MKDDDNIELQYLKYKQILSEYQKEQDSISESLEKLKSQEIDLLQNLQKNKKVSGKINYDNLQDEIDKYH